MKFINFKYLLCILTLGYGQGFLNRIGPGIHNINQKMIESVENNEEVRKLGVNLVRGISAGLPKVDNIGHQILHANNEFINDILNNQLLDHDTQKFIILSSIKLAQMGDDMGSHLLQIYYDIVDMCL